jgi:hypothetical protein
MRRICGLILVTVVGLAACGDDGGATTVPTLGTTAATVVTTSGPSGTTTPGPGPGMGDGVVLAALRTSCEAGDMVMCDLLYMSTPLGSELEAYGDSCGGRNEPAGWCADIYDVAIDLDDLAGDCVGGDMLACDMVYMYSDIGSEEEALGASCGGRGKTESTCVMEYGLP